MPVAAIVSFRLGGTDGVAVVAESWRRALVDLGFEVMTVAGEGQVDRRIPGLTMEPGEAPSPGAVAGALADADLVVVENLCTIPLNLPASRAVAAAIAGRPAILHHHDPPWQRPHHAHVTELPPTDPVWRHVTINRLTEAQFAERGIYATTIYNGFDVDAPAGDRTMTRVSIGVGPHQRLLVHPVRAIPRKDIPAAIRLAEQLEATYWLLGPPEFGYAYDLSVALDSARCPVIHRPSPGTVADAYAASDAVVFPSTWEGFGNPPVEAAIHRRPAAVGPYPVADELRALGFGWFPTSDPTPLDQFLHHPDLNLLDQNQELSRRHFSQQCVVDSLRHLLDGAGWLP